jgi:hypothetical protein
MEQTKKIEPLSNREALELAVEMLHAISEGKSYNTGVYYSNMYRIRQTLAVETINNAATHVLNNCDTFNDEWIAGDAIFSAAMRSVKADQF